MEISENTVTREYNNFISAMVSYGSLDIERAIKVAIEVEEDGDWVADVVQEQAEQIETDVFKLDIVAEVYSSILQTSRNEIDDLIKFDFCNDGADVYVAGNYCATSYDWGDNANETVKEKLIENEIEFSDLSVKCQWFLTEIEANY